MAVSTTDSAYPLRHLALFYRGPSEYVAATAAFILAGLAAGERVLVAVPEQKAQALRAALKSKAKLVSFADISSVGRNPARLLSALQTFVCAVNGRARVVGEPIWPGRSAAEIREATRHEALVNLALGEADLSLLCPYDSAGLPTGVIANACRTHPTLLRGEGEEPSMGYSGPRALPADCDQPLPPPPSTAEMISYDQDLRPVRCLIASRAGEAGMLPVRTADLVVAVSEIAANSLVHAGGGGTVTIWRAADELICQVQDGGHITDPLAGRQLPAPTLGGGHGSKGGHGLWLVNRFCDLTEVRSSAADGTVVRVHMGLPDAS
jgi:anti-sigma regulatory factor (Ser/Thr protein kinase)